MSSNTIQSVSEGRSERYNQHLVSLIGNKLFYINRDASSSIAANYGWLTTIDLSNGTKVEHRTETGDYFGANYLISNNGEKYVILHYHYPDPANRPLLYTIALRYFNLETRAVETIQLEGMGIPVSNGLIGWNGNNKNVIVVDGNMIFYNINIETKKITKITNR